MKDSKFDGFGEYTWPNGQIYLGDFKNNIRVGKGLFTHPNGTKYDGSWKDGKFDGFGEEH